MKLVINVSLYCTYHNNYFIVDILQLLIALMLHLVISVNSVLMVTMVILIMDNHVKNAFVITTLILM